MAAFVGTAALALALALAVYGAVAAIVGVRTRGAALVESARTTAYSLFALVLVANAAMLAALMADDFSVSYVAENSSRATPSFFKVLALWSADEGSLLLWNLVLAGFLGAVAFAFRRRRPETFPWALAVMFGVSAFYLVLVLGPTTPFGTVDPVPADGRGPLPLLQNHPLMAAHPPFLYLGFIGFTVPFAFAVASLITGRVSDAWMRITRRWTLAAWVFLTVGLLLGALWSYGVLGWGGYWAWDPVENVALLPWLTATAFVHSVMVQERRGMLKVWNSSLIVGTFALTVLGTFLTRGSILASVHTFAASLVGPLYLGFLTVVLVGGFGLIAWRRRALAAEAAVDTPLSRESAFLANNLLLLVITFTVLVGTLYPLLAEAVRGTEVSVGAPFFNRNAAPVVLLLLFLMGVGPILPWRAASLGSVVRRLQVPLWSAAAVAVTFVVAGAGPGPTGIFALIAFVTTATLAEMARGVRAQRRATGASVPSASVAAIRRNRRLYGGLVAHLGLLVAVVGVSWSAFADRAGEGSIARGATTRVEAYDVRYDELETRQEAHRRVTVARLTVLDAATGDVIVRLHPSLNFYPASSEPIGTPSVRVGTPWNGMRDLYASLVAVDPGTERVTVRFVVNPGIGLLWLGGGVIALGGLAAAWPRRRSSGDRPHLGVAPVSEPVASREEVQV
ncbi:MAG TPA: cytochrome c-type biogenesis CcmF C-terminal domain-containing protein [Actinomycetota bacterium]|nr:cytochrome c-type biogenesis CcmF C-terminal domain-containing protein [Actinomycetota bacterium]